MDEAIGAAALCALPFLLLMMVSMAIFYPLGWRSLLPLMLGEAFSTVGVALLTFGTFALEAPDAMTAIAWSGLAAGWTFVGLAVATFFARHALQAWFDRTQKETT